MELSEIIEAIKHLKLSSYQIAKETTISQPGLDKIISGESKNPRKSTISLLENYIMKKLNKEKSYTTNETTIAVQEHSEQLANRNGNIFELKNGKFRIFVKKIPVKAFGSYLSDYQDPEFFEELEEVSFTVDHLGRGNYIAFEVQGESMNGGGINDAPEGAELLCRELGRQHWKDGFRDSVYGWVIVHESTVLYKDIKDVNMETGDMILGSRSGLPQHRDFIINMNEVRQIWKVIKRSF